MTLTSIIDLRGQNLDYIPQIAPPSPEAYKLSRYGDIQLQGNTGAFSHSIPIYDINFHGISLPITLSYSSNGVLVDELSGFTGTSWTLNAGGVISRTVRGVADEKAQERWYPDSIEPINVNAEKIKSYANKDNVTQDSQQDWFFVNIGNISTSFFFDENLNILKSNDDDVRIQYSTIGSILEFKITDKNGNIYILGGNEDFVEKNTMSQDCVVGPKTTYYSAWYLKEIITPNNQKISFAYNSFQQSFISSASYNETYTSSCYSDGSFDRNPSSCRSINQTTSKALSSIYFGNNKIVFDYRTDRKDEGSLLLSNISVYNNTKLIKREELIYDEIYNNQKVQDSRLSLNPSIHYRYFLKEINNYDSSNIFQNKFSFDYYNLSSIPPRLSWNKDLYGYYNGKSNNSAFDKSLIINPETIFIVRNQTANFTADLSVNPTTAYYGMLKRITYPSKGYSDIEYESNSNNIESLKNVYDINNLEASKDACNGGINNNYEKFFEFISNGEKIHFQTNYSVERCENVYDDDFHDVYFIKVYNVTGGQNSLIFTGKGRFDKIIRTVSEGEFATGETLFNPIPTINNNKYKVVITAETKLNIVSLDASFQYNRRNEPYTYTKYYGGVRVKSTTDFDGISKTNKKDYFYNTYQEKDSGFTTIKETNPPKLYETSRVVVICRNLNDGMTNVIVNNAIKMSVNNSSINQLYNNRSQSVGYKIISSSSNLNNQNNGYSESYFYNDPERDSETYSGFKIYGTPSSNNFEGYTGLIFKNKIYNKNNILIKETDNLYTPIKENKTFRNWAFKEIFQVTNVVVPVDWIGNISIEHYENFSRTVKPTKTITKDYLTGGTVTTETNYVYGGVKHNQLTEESTTNSKGELVKKTYKYVPDYNAGTTTVLGKMEAKNMVLPIETKVFNGSTQISEQKTDYYEPYTGIFLPQYVYVKKGATTTAADRKITYNSYDKQGNLTQYTLENGLPVSIIWGYNNQYPVAKLEGVALSQINGATITTLNTKTTDADLLTALTSLRTAHKDAMVTGYLYKPLIGVTQIIQPNGVSEKYNYDSSNRLQSIVNDKNEVLKTFQYNYKP